MASENGQEKRETLADIVAEMRNEVGDGMDTYAGLRIVRHMEDARVRNYCDRIKAAWRRERSEIEANALTVGGIVEAARHSPGNSAAMREALIQLRDGELAFCEKNIKAQIGLSPLGLYHHCRIIRETINAALSAPARNCDAMPWRKAWDEWRAKHHPQNPQTFNESYEATVAFMEWFTAPASEKGATA